VYTSVQEYSIKFLGISDSNNYFTKVHSCAAMHDILQFCHLIFGIFDSSTP
jgi:hypothetical protein